MRTTLEIDDDIVAVAKQLAAQRKMTMGKGISELARRALEPGSEGKMRNGVLVFPARRGARKATLELVNRLRDEE
jgi:tRNA/tmRNA/rRNA uracil-C5-methylase (TrmA/RlmC/RlmD family)